MLQLVALGLAFGFSPKSELLQSCRNLVGWMLNFPPTSGQDEGLRDTEGACSIAVPPQLSNLPAISAMMSLGTTKLLSPADRVNLIVLLSRCFLSLYLCLQSVFRQRKLQFPSCTGSHMDGFCVFKLLLSSKETEKWNIKGSHIAAFYSSTQNALCNRYHSPMRFSIFTLRWTHWRASLRFRNFAKGDFGWSSQGSNRKPSG